MTASSGSKEPSRPTVKRLFAVSGNLCAFPKCSTSLVDPQSGSIVGEICHIKGEKPGAARFDPNQANEQRQGYENLILLCNVHHKIVDDDDAAYTVERLVQMKQDHECRHTSSAPVDEATAERFVTTAIGNSTVHGSVFSSHGQTGGQTAHSIINYYGTPSNEEAVQLEGKLDLAGDIEVLNTLGCAGMRLTVICRGARPAKIQSAFLLVDGVDVMRGMQQGFGTDFGYTPLKGSTQTLAVKLIPLSRPNSQEGYVLNRDDVARFFYPLPIPSTTLALRAIPEELCIVVRLFDDSERTLLSGRDVKSVLESLFEIYHERPGQLKVPIQMDARVKSTTPAKMDMVGRLNPNYVPMAQPADISSSQGASEERSSLIGLGPLGFHRDSPLSQDAIELLRKAASGDGIVSVITTDAGLAVLANDRQLNEMGNARSEARYRQIIENLWHAGLITQIEAVGHVVVYKLTHSANEYIDKTK